MEKDLLLLRGSPGSGKTTTAEVIAQGRPSAKEVAADDYMINESGEYEFDHRRLAECHGKCLVQVEDWMREVAAVSDSPRADWSSSLIIVHNTFTKNWEMGAYFELAEKYGYRVHVLKKEGNYGNIHSVPEATIDRMESTFEPLDLKRVQKSSAK